MSSSAPDHLHGGALQAAISNGVVGTISEFTGRGPTKVRTTFSGDWVFVTLEDSLTKGERKLAQLGREDSVTRTRHDYQTAMESDLTKMVEELTGRKVLGYQSQLIFEPEVVIEIFFFDRAPDHAPVAATARGLLEDPSIGEARDDAHADDVSGEIVAD